jgi:hypothetical protein
MQLNSPSRKNRRRRGLAVAELAVCLPVLVLVTLAMIETCTMIFLKQSLAVAAYEGAHTALAPGSTTADVRAVCDGILADRRVQGATVTLVPARIESVPEGSFFEIRVSAPTDRNAVLPGKFFRGMTLTSSAEFMNEMPR